MTLNGVMAVTLRCFSECDKPAFQHTGLTASARIELIDQKSASITHRTVGVACVTKCTHSRVDTKLRENQGFQRYLLLIYRLSFALPLPSLF